MMRKFAPVLLAVLALACAPPPEATQTNSSSHLLGGGQPANPAPAPAPLLAKDKPVQWLFVFKLNSAAFPECGGSATRVCQFGGTVQKYKSPFGQQFAYASSDAHSLQQGIGCAGDTTADPVGATFDEIYNGSFHYVVWNDQFYNDPPIKGCSKNCDSPWGHSKGVVTWNEAGEGFVMQVTTPSWPASGSKNFPGKRTATT